MILQRREFGVVHRHQPGHPHSCLIAAGQVQPLRRIGDRLCRGQAGLQCVEIEHRLDLDEAAQFFRFRRPTAGQLAPREMRRPVVQRSVDRVAGHLHRPGQGIEPIGTVGDAHQPLRQRAESPAQARIGGQRPDQRPSPAHFASHSPQLVARQEQEAVAGEKGATLGLLDRLKMCRVGRQRGGQLGGCPISRFGGRRIDDDQHVVLRKGPDEIVGALGPRQFGREQLLDIGRHREMARRVESAESGQRDRQHDDRPSVPGAQLDEANDR